MNNTPINLVSLDQVTKYESFKQEKGDPMFLVRWKNGMVKWYNTRKSKAEILRERAQELRAIAQKSQKSVRSLAGYIHELNTRPTRDKKNRFGGDVYTKHKAVFRDHLADYRSKQQPIGV